MAETKNQINKTSEIFSLISDRNNRIETYKQVYSEIQRNRESQGEHSNGGKSNSNNK